MSGRLSCPLEPFFLDGHFCLYYPPSQEAPPRGALLYAHPFGEEMNKSRRMVALQARRFAQLGYGVLLIDLHGCGDSAGDFSEASWEAWKTSLATGLAWLRSNGLTPVTLWGLRLGASLALDFAIGAGARYESILLWQPVVKGEAYLNQFLRLALASQMLAKGKPESGIQELRSALDRGKSLEIAGYELSPRLAKSIAQIDLEKLAPAGARAHWLEVSPQPPATLSAAARRVTESWRVQGISINAQRVIGEAFWATQEISECPALLEASSNVIANGTVH
jgi:exosortase A-associated hydrolase 2